MSARAELDRACRLESARSIGLADDARDYVAGDLSPEGFLNAAYLYGRARLERERLRDQMWGPLP